MLVKEPTSLVREIRELISAREAIVRARVNGKLFFLSESFSEESDRDHSPVIWILRAHIGTLDKINTFFVSSEPPNTLEVLAIARNLFENLVWLRLFSANPQFGLVFYEQLITQHRESTERFIKKIEQEITLFEECQRLEADNFNAVYASLDPNGTNEEVKERIESAKRVHAALNKDLDTKVRRSFALFAQAATVNGYGFQCHLLREKVMPKHVETLRALNERLRRYQTCKGTLLSPELQRISHWSWKRQANEVGMSVQYEFLYSFTSKLLHSSPMNLITEKELEAPEMVTILDYCYITVADILETIEAFTFPGARDVAIVEIE